MSKPDLKHDEIAAALVETAIADAKAAPPPRVPTRDAELVAHERRIVSQTKNQGRFSDF